MHGPEIRAIIRALAKATLARTGRILLLIAALQFAHALVKDNSGARLFIAFSPFWRTPQSIRMGSITVTVSVRLSL